MNIKEIVEGMTAPQVAQVIKDNFNEVDKDKANKTDLNKSISDLASVVEANKTDLNKSISDLASVVEANKTDLTKKIDNNKEDTDEKLSELESEIDVLESLGKITKPSYEKVIGKYVTSLGEVISYNGWFYSTPISLKKGETLLFSAVAYKNATISIYDNGAYKKVVEGVETSKQLYEYVASEDCEVVVSGEDRGAFVVIAMAEEKGGNVVNLCKNPFFDSGWILGVGLSCIVNDGIVKATSSNGSNFHRIEYTGTTLSAGKTYFIYCEVKAHKYNKVKIYTDQFSDEFDVYNSQHFKPVFWLVTPKEDVTNIGIYVNDVYANTIGESFELRKPIIIDVKDCFNHDISVSPTIPSYEKVTGKYVTSLGEVASNNGWFYSSPIRMNAGQKMVINIKNSAGYWAIISKADFSPIVQAGSERGNKYEYVASAAEDVVISGAINDMDVSIIGGIGAEYNYLKICHNWRNYDVPTSFNFNVENDKRSYLVASLGSRYESVADVVCYGENDQLEINRLISRSPGNTIYFADDSRYLLSAPILPMTSTSLISNGAKFNMIDMVESVVTYTQESKYLSVDNIDKYVKGMYLYCADDHQYNVVKEIFCSSNQIEIQIPKKYSDEDFVIKTASPAIYIRRKENVMIDGLSIDLNVANNPIQPANPWYLQEGVTIDESKRVTIQNCRICNGGRRGITTYDAIHFYLLNNYFNNWHEHSIDIFNSYTANGNTTELPIMNHGVITGNVCENNKMSGIQCHRGSGCTIANNVIRNVLHGGIRCQEYAHDNSITGNVIENCVRGLYLNGFNISATGNTIKDSAYYGILVGERAGYVSIVGNAIHNSIYSAIRLEANASYCNISDNLLENNNTIMDEESFSDDRAAVISIGNGSDRYGGNNHYNVIKCNYIVEEPNTSKYAYVNINEDNTNNLFIRNIITGIAEDNVKAQETDIVRDNDFVM